MYAIAVMVEYTIAHFAKNQEQSNGSMNTPFKKLLFGDDNSTHSETGEGSVITAPDQQQLLFGTIADGDYHSHEESHRLQLPQKIHQHHHHHHNFQQHRLNHSPTPACGGKDRSKIRRITLGGNCAQLLKAPQNICTASPQICNDLNGVGNKERLINYVSLQHKY